MQRYMSVLCVTDIADATVYTVCLIFVSDLARTERMQCMVYMSGLCFRPVTDRADAMEYMSGLCFRPVTDRANATVYMSGLCFRPIPLHPLHS